MQKVFGPEFSYLVGGKESEKAVTQAASQAENVIVHIGKNRRSVRVVMLNGRTADFQVEVSYSPYPTDHHPSFLTHNYNSLFSRGTQFAENSLIRSFLTTTSLSLNCLVSRSSEVSMAPCDANALSHVTILVHSHVI